MAMNQGEPKFMATSLKCSFFLANAKVSNIHSNLNI